MNDQEDHTPSVPPDPSVGLNPDVQLGNCESNTPLVGVVRPSRRGHQMNRTPTDALLQRTECPAFTPPRLRIPSWVPQSLGPMMSFRELAPHSSSSGEVALEALPIAAERDRKNRSASFARVHRPTVEREWAVAASQELGQLDAEADDVGWPRPGPVAVSYASAFIRSLSGIANLPLPSVTPDQDGSVSIQVGRRDYIFVLTCCEDKTGIFNVTHKEYALQGHYRNMEVDRIPNSRFFRQIACLLRTATRG